MLWNWSFPWFLTWHMGCPTLLQKFNICRNINLSQENRVLKNGFEIVGSMGQYWPPSVPHQMYSEVCINFLSIVFFFFASYQQMTVQWVYLFPYHKYEIIVYLEFELLLVVNVYVGTTGWWVPKVKCASCFHVKQTFFYSFLHFEVGCTLIRIRFLAVSLTTVTVVIDYSCK